jgi:hypothetical protein
VRQTAYQIQVAATAQNLLAGHEILWDSHSVPSASYAGIAYAGEPLEPAHIYAWRVRVWDEQNRQSSWTPIAHWTQAPVWHAAWIAASTTDTESTGDSLPLFRKRFTVPRPIARAVLYASGLGQQELRINGHKVGDDQLTPGWSDYHKTVYYDAYDVTHLLKMGQNTLGIMLGNGMYRVMKTPDRYTKFTGSYGPLKCTLQLRIEFAGGGSVEIDSDGTWKTHPGPVTFSSTYGGEDYDARKEPRAWDGTEVGNGDFNDSDWRSAIVVDGPGGVLQRELAPPIRILHTYAPVHVTELKHGLLVYDLGQNFAGWPSISVAGLAGSVVKLTPGELLNSDGTVSQQSSGSPQWFSYTLRGSGVENWRPRFSYYGFRYVQVEGAGRTAETGKAQILRIVGEAVHSSSAVVGSFASSDETLNRIHQLIVRAIENNAESLFTDCPHREKLGWLEETHLLAPSILYDFDLSGLYEATARNVADVQRTAGDKTGMVPEIAPQYVVFDSHNEVFNDSPEWGSAAVLAPWYAYQRNGDAHFLTAQLNVMRRYVAYLGTRAHDGIIDYGLGDWYDIGPGEPGLSKLTTAGVTATATYVQDLKVMEKVTAILGFSSESEQYRRQAEDIRNAFNARFFDATLHRYDKGSQTAQAMPLVIGMVPDGEREAVLNALVQDIRAHENHVTAGDVGYHYVVDALLDGDRSDVMLDMLRRKDSPSYGYQLAQGATSLTEAWDANPSSSQDHFMLGDAEEWLYRSLGGINVDLSKQGAQRLIVHPMVLNGIHSVNTKYRSALGTVVSKWRRGDSQTEYYFQIPVNTTATIILDTLSPTTIEVNGMPAGKARGILTASMSDAAEAKTIPQPGFEGRTQSSSKGMQLNRSGQRLQLTLTSGSYHILAANPLQIRP